MAKGRQSIGRHRGLGGSCSKLPPLDLSLIRKTLNMESLLLRFFQQQLAVLTSRKNSQVVDGSVTWPKCHKKEWRGKSFRLHPRENRLAVFQRTGSVIPSLTCPGSVLLWNALLWKAILELLKPERNCASSQCYCSATRHTRKADIKRGWHSLELFMVKWISNNKSSFDLAIIIQLRHFERHF